MKILTLFQTKKLCLSFQQSFSLSHTHTFTHSHTAAFSFLPVSFYFFNHSRKMKKREEMKIHVWKKHTENNYFLHFSHMNLLQTNVFVCFHVLPRKIHIFRWEVFIILVSFFKLLVKVWQHRLAFTLKTNPVFWVKLGIGKCRHSRTLPAATDVPKHFLSQVKKLKNSKLVPYITSQRTLITPSQGKRKHQPSFGFGIQAQSEAVWFILRKNPKMFPKIRTQQPWLSSSFQVWKVLESGWSLVLALQLQRLIVTR